jgi:hypothetical protein
LPIHIHIEAQTPEELAAHLAIFYPAAAAAAALSPSEADPGRVNGESSDPVLDELLGGVGGELDTAAADEEPPVAQDKPKRGRGRPRKVEVAQDEPEAAQTEPELAPEGDEANPNPFADEAADAAARDPKVDWGLALELLRAVYDRPGAAAKVNAVLTHYGVTKFTNIPKSAGTELLARARALDEEHPAV